MKKFITLFALIILTVACSTDETTPPAANTAPKTSTLVSPKDVCVDPKVVFLWNATTDAEGNEITYQLEVAKSSTFADIAKTVEGTAVTQTVDLEAGKSYYWRVKATDDKGLSSSYSAVFSFTTASATTNQLPNAPELVAPTLNASITTATTTLSWTGSDPDAGDALVYDVYFGTTNPPTEKIATAITAMTTTATTATATNYYWKVVARDSKGGETIGQVWAFSKQ